jgi:hypothetical protein
LHVASFSLHPAIKDTALIKTILENLLFQTKENFVKSPEEVSVSELRLHTETMLQSQAESQVISQLVVNAVLFYFAKRGL